MKLINKNLVKNSKSSSIDEAFNEIAELLFNENLIKTKQKIIDGLFEREKKSSTALEQGIAIPHTVCDELEDPKIIVLNNVSIDEWKTLDGSKVDMVVSIIVPKSGREDHLKILSSLSSKLANTEFVAKLKKEKSSSKIATTINSIEFSIGEKDTKGKKDKISYDVVAVTSCPTGIAHTYMAAEKLQEAAKELGISIKVETQGQTVQNILTQEEINSAKGIIIAVDKEVDMARFSGKNIIKTGTKKVIAEGKKYIEDSMSDSGTEVVKSTVTATNSGNTGQIAKEMTLDNFGRRSWKAVMNGVSYMLPFVVFGGIFIAISFLIDIPNAGESSYGSTTQAANFFNSIGGVSMGLMVPILTAFTMEAMIGRQGILPGFVIGMLAIGNGPQFTEVFGVNTPEWLPSMFSETTSVSSGFIGGIVGAFLGIVIIVNVSNLLDTLPRQLRGIKQILLLPLIGTAFASVTFWFVNIPLIYITWGLLTVLFDIDQAGLTWLLALFLGGMMAIDMGGPINKTAYVFGTVMLGQSIESGFDAGQIYMAAVMAGGMVPPLALALATLFKRGTLWDEEDIDAGYTNWVMGASFITEGAIPFASKYPKAVMPGIILGSAIAGLLTGLFQIHLGAPHGGIFVFALVNTSLVTGSAATIGVGITLYVLSILIGTIIAASSILFLRTWEVKNKANKVESI